ncbi:MAG: hypothetical protein KGQ51_16010 [Planctomycetes bacterium]|nr:hypothetical protein [Planctomycetota bacterium]
MARRKRSEGSSLDLFLDTICNAFGGIMFISILISILIQMRGNVPDNPDRDKGLSEAEAIQKQTQLFELQSKSEILAQSIAERERLLFNEDTAEVSELQAKRDAIRKQLEDIQKVQQSLLGESAKKDQEIQKTEEELKNFEQRLQDARVAVSERSKEVEDSLDAAETNTTLPKVTSTLKGNLLFGIRYGKVYLVSDVQGGNANAVNAKHVNAVSTPLGIRVTLRQDAGWKMESNEAKTELQALMRNHPSVSTYFSIAVWPDSFEEFLKWKETLIREGYDYDLSPIDNMESFVIVPGSSAKVQ